MVEGFDVVVVGAGSAGCVLAARASENPAVRVLLLEAGPDFVGATVPAYLLDATRGPSIRPETDWGLTGRSGPGGRTLGLPRGRVTGGCSAVNATFALRGSPADYDAWSAAGNPGWGFSDLLASFVRAEADADFPDDAYHGAAGPVPIRRYRGAAQSRWAAACAAALQSAGLPAVEDHNAPGVVGVGPLPVNAIAGQRVGAAAAYVDPVRHRPNLVVRGHALVRRVVLARGRVLGVELVDGGYVAADEVVVSAGTYLSPGILVRSGIGPATELEELGMEVAADLPGVGANLQDHPVVSIDVPYLAPMRAIADAETAPAAEPVFQLVATQHSTSADPASDAPDIQLFVCGPNPPGGDSDGPAACFVAASLVKPRSRGSVRTTSADPAAPPLIDLGYFSEPTDLPRLVEGFRLAETAVAEPAVASLTGGRRNPPLLAGDGDHRRHVRANVWSYHHPVGTCAMGPDPAEGAVVDAECRVYGVAGLSVVDASVMPEIPSANTHLPTLAVAEHVAARRWATMGEALARNA